ncbi:MAG: hypothetical protein HY066_14300 [Betaproteobacteria bacterium]|nr:hypothetical protein [Betaproteobacteria bacterium]
MSNKHIRIFTGFVAFFASASVGLLLFSTVVGFTGWISPFWWGGEALFPMLAGFVTILVGTVPFHALTRVLLAKFHSNIAVGITSLVGAILGASLIPLVFVVSALLDLVLFGRMYEYPLILVVIGFGVAGLLGTVLGIVSACLLLKNDGESEESTGPGSN